MLEIIQFVLQHTELVRLSIHFLVQYVVMPPET